MKFIKDNLCFVICMIILGIGLICLGIWGIPKLIDSKQNMNNDQNNVENNTDNNQENDSSSDDTQKGESDNLDNETEEEYEFTTLNSEKYNSLSIPVNINTTSDTDIEKNSVDINSELVKQLYKMVIVEDSIKTSLYTNSKVTAKDLDKNDILIKALDEVRKCEYDSEGNVTNDVDVKFTPEDLKEKVIELYGADYVKDYKGHIDESAYGGWHYDSVSNTYIPEGGVSGCFSDNINISESLPVVKVTKDENNIYMYTEMYFSTSGFGNTSVYANYSDYENSISIGSQQSDNVPYTRFEGSLEYDNLFNYFKDRYPNIIYTYKHTFKKNTNGTYYWVSTEPLTK